VFRPIYLASSDTTGNVSAPTVFRVDSSAQP